MRKLYVAVLAVMALVLISACGSNTQAVPTVQGIRLDTAHNILKDAGFKKFTDTDAVSDRTSLMDSNWVVVSQDPLPGIEANPKDTVKLKIAKPGDANIRELLPESSPLLAELREKDAEAQLKAEKKQREKEEEQRKQEEKDKQAAENRLAQDATFLEDLDPTLRIAQGAVRDLERYMGDVGQNSVTTTEASGYRTSFSNFTTTYTQRLSVNVPNSLGGKINALKAAMEKFNRVPATLFSAATTQDQGAIDRARVVFEEARSEHNQALIELYDGSDIPAPTI